MAQRETNPGVLNCPEWFRLFKPHPWHGIPIGSQMPDSITCYVEIVPSDTVKYEIDKPSGYLRIDRPQRYSNVCPTLYGFVPQTVCGRRVAEHSSARVGRTGMRGDGDPMDICVLTDRSLTHGDLLLNAAPIGGLRMVDADAVDDKIVGVLEEDSAFGLWRDIADCPDAIIERLRHYFLTYKSAPGKSQPGPDSGGDRFIADVYGREEAHKMIRLSHQDYCDQFPDLFRQFEEWQKAVSNKRS